RLGVLPGGARRAVPPVDVDEAPDDLRLVVGAPVRADGRHLAAGQRLRDAVRAAGCVVRVRAPAGLAVPQRRQAPLLTVAGPAEVTEPRPGVGLRGCGVVVL